MKSASLGIATSKAEVLNISHHGVWVLAAGAEYFLSYAKFPWFKKAKIAEVMNVKLIRKLHLRWPALDVDVHIHSLTRPEQYPLTYKK